MLYFFLSEDKAVKKNKNKEYVTTFLCTSKKEEDLASAGAANPSIAIKMFRCTKCYRRTDCSHIRCPLIPCNIPRSLLALLLLLGIVFPLVAAGGGRGGRGGSGGGGSGGVVL